MRRHAPDLKFEDLPMTSMIDIVFQLLIFFMLTMRFQEVEGKLMSNLPKIRGIERTAAPPDLGEVRIYLCADDGAGIRLHRSRKEEHDDPARPKDPSRCRIYVEQIEIGGVVMSERDPAGAAGNRAIYAAVAGRAETLLRFLPPDARLVIDADRESPYEHVIGLVDALQRRGLSKVEFVADARWAQEDR